MPPSVADVAEALPVSSSRIDEYLDLWSIEEARGLALYEALSTTDWPAHLSAWRERQQVREQQRQEAGKSGGKPYPMTADGVAVIDLVGTLMKQESSMEDSTSTIRARRMIRQAVADGDVKAILLRIDSPGGTAAGTAELADDVAAAARVKWTEAAIVDCCCSAAYWIASQANRITANRTAIVGSIGTFAVVYDLSARAAQQGVKVHVVRAGEFKGMGVPGTEISAAQLQQVQRRVTDVNEHFLAGVGQGRRMASDRVRELADGRTHSSAEAVKLGLIDGVGTLDEALASVAMKVQAQGRKGTMTQQAQTTTEPTTTTAAAPAAPATTTQPSNPPARVAATLGELKAACPGASSDFLLGQLEKQATVAEAMTAFIADRNQALEAANKRAEEAAKAPPTAPKAKGHAMPEEKANAKTTVDGDPVKQFNDAVAEKMTAEKMSKRDATRAVCREQPELHAAMLNAVNQKAGCPANFAA